MASITAAAAGGNWTTGASWVGGVAPTAADDAFLDATSGNIVVDSGSVCRSLNCTGYTGTLSGSAGLSIGDGTAGAGNIALKLVAGMTFTYNSATFTFGSTSGTQQTITTSGKTVYSFHFDGAGGSWILSDNLTMQASQTINLEKGSLDVNGQSVSAGGIYSSHTSARSLTLGAATITLVSAGTVWNFATTTNLTFSGASATIVISDTGATGKTFAGGGLTYGTLSITTGGAGAITITGDNTFAALTNTGSSSKAIKFEDGSNTFLTGTTFFSGVSGGVITITSVSGGSWDLHRDDATIVCDYLSLEDSQAGGSAAWYAGSHSTDVGDNAGWIFEDEPPISLSGTVEAVLGSSGALSISGLALIGAVEAVAVSSGTMGGSLGLTGTAAANLQSSGHVSINKMTHSGAVAAVLDGYALLILLEGEMLDYDGANNGLFRHLGKLIKHYNLQRTDGTDLDPDVLEIMEAFQAGDKDLIIEGMAGHGENWKGQHILRRSYLVEIGLKRLQHREDVLEEIGATSDQISEILTKLYKQMTSDGETINRSTVTIAGLQALSPANTGNGRLLVTTKLDGVTSPGRGPNLTYQPCPNYRGVASELANTAETMLLTCSTDVGVDGIAEGHESFIWGGGPANTQHGMEDNEGSGLIAEFQVANASNLLDNLDFENASLANTPDSWTLGGGAAGTVFFIDTSAGNFLHGLAALKIVSNGGNHYVSQAVPGIGFAVDANQGFLVSCWLKADASVGAGEFILRFEGAGYTAAVGTTKVVDIQIAGTPTAGTYVLGFPRATGTPITTGDIAFDATSAAVQTALRTISGLEAVTVATQAGSPPNVTHRVTLHGVWGNPPLFTGQSSMTGGTPTITITQVTAGVDSEEIRIPAAALPTSWRLCHFFVVMPATMPVDLALFIRTASITATKTVWVDDVAFAPIQYGGGIGLHVVRGSSSFIRGDRFQFDLTNDNAGVIQTALRRWFGFQLPSSANPTILDSLAT